MAERAHHIVVYGATGFVGELTALYLARSAPPECRWAIAGRNRAKLDALRGRLATIDAGLATLPIIEADSGDATAMRALAESTRAVATTVGPYVHYGEPLVAACAETGTDYLDLTGEPEFVDTVYVRHHERATQTGARLIHACGFDSIPHDLGTYYTVLQLPEDVPITVRGYVQVSAAASGGTAQSAITAFSRFRQTNAAARERRRLEPREPGRSARAVPGRPHHSSQTDGWALPLPTIDPQIVARSARAVPRYGPEFRYSHFVSLPHVWTAAGVVVGAAGLFGLAQLPPTRKALLARMPAGGGPSEDKRARSWFRVTFVGEGGGKRVVTRVSGGDPGYDETARMLGQAALAITSDDVPRTAGQVTTAQAMGDALLARLQKAGMRFEVLSTTTS